MRKRQVLELTEHCPVYLQKEELTSEIGEWLWKNYNKQVQVEFPTHLTAHQWRLTAQGWVGSIPISTHLELRLIPKVAVSNLFQMLDYAYQLRNFIVLDDLIECDSLDDLYERLAQLLANMVFQRSKKGFYQEYRDNSDKLPYVRGRIDTMDNISKPWEVHIRCNYQERTADIEENQILCWTLWLILCSGFCGEKVTMKVRRAFKSLHGHARLVPLKDNDLTRQSYNRLSQDYEPMHILCRFFLDNIGPGHRVGAHKMLPFLVNMARLYEQFVAQWLVEHLPDNYRLKKQERLQIDHDGELIVSIDLVIYDWRTNQVLYILDTKYKVVERPSPQDVYQIVTYAVAKECHEAILIYPFQVTNQREQRIGQIRLRMLSFPLGGDLGEAGQTFLRDLFKFS
ncbi:McrC family protein [Heliorestis acidaminivorans]|nr:restriction endonuclease [Heliorestis acidaminivorans]